jgi:flagellar protein FliS
MVKQHALNQYQQVNVQSTVAAASPHRLVQMLMDGVLQRVAEARGALSRSEIALKGERIGKAISIVGGLREALNRDLENRLVEDLDALYDYVQRRLIEANTTSDDAILVEVSQLMHTVKEGWDGIAQDPAAQMQPA